MTSHGRSWDKAKNPGLLLLMAGIYSTAHVSLYALAEYTQVGEYSLWYPPAGLMLAVVIRFRLVGAVLAFLGSMLAYLLFDGMGGSYLAALMMSALPTLTALIVRNFMIGFGLGNSMMPRPQIALALIVACFLYALTTTAVSMLTASVIDIGVVFTPNVALNWFLGDFLGGLATIGLCFQLLHPLMIGQLRVEPGRRRQLIASSLLFAAIALLPMAVASQKLAHIGSMLGIFAMAPILYAGLWRGAAQTSLAIFFANIGLLLASSMAGSQEAHQLQAIAILISAGGMMMVAITTHQRAMVRTLQMTLAQRDQLFAERSELDNKLSNLRRLDSLGQMAGGLAHEINNLLHPILSFSRAAVNAEEGQRRHYLQRVRECAEAARLVVADVLSFARSEASEQTGPEAQVSARSALESAFAIAARDVDPGINYEQSIELGDEQIQAAPERLTQLLINLVRNGCDAIKTGGHIRLDARSIDLDTAAVTSLDLLPGIYVRVQVCDDGSGMDEATKVRAFEPFFTTKPVGRGTGLGLSVAYGFARRWQGQLVLDSTLGAGTCVSLYIPVVGKTADVSQFAIDAGADMAN
jgi:signal transduction histidine kinase